jgi:hypothetical protein
MKNNNIRFGYLIGLICLIVTSSSAQTCVDCTTSTPINSGLVACYPFNNNTNDQTSINGNGTNNGATLTVDRFGAVNSAYNFGAGKSIAIPATTLSSNAYTYAMWVKINTLPPSGSLASIISIGNSGILGDQCININNNYSGNSGFIASSYRASGADFAVTGVLPSVGVWYHIASVRDIAANKIKIYVNGTKISESSLATSAAGYSTPVLGFIGARTPGNTSYFDGTIDDVRIYTRALSDAEMSQLYVSQGPLILTAMTDKTICQGDSVQLNAAATGATSYSWSPTSGLSSGSIANPIAKPTSTQQYIVTISNGTCSTKDTVLVSVQTNCCISCTTPGPINSGLVACYPFNGNTGDETNLNGAGTNNGATLATDRFGNTSRAYTFNNKSIAIPAANLALNTYTYSTWVKINALPSSGSLSTILSTGNTGALGDQTININNNYSGTSGFIASSYRASGADFAVSGVLPSVGIWYHVVSVRDVASNKIKLYVNGVKAAEAALTTPAAGYSTPVLGYIGARSPGNVSYFNGTIDDVRIYSRALTDLEIQYLYVQANTIAVSPISDKTICAGDSVQLIATGGSSYLWSPSTGLSNPTISSPYAKPTSTQQYVVTISGSCGSTTDTVIISVDSAIALVSGEDVSVCLGDSVQLKVSGAATYLWSPATGLSNTTIANPIAYPLKTTDYIVKGFSGTCKPQQDTIRVSVCVCTTMDTVIVYDTIRVIDTVMVTVYDTVKIAVTDTLFIDITTGIAPAGRLLNTIKVYPNPAHDVVLIDNGNYALMSGYSLHILNALGQSVFSNTISQQNASVSTATLGGAGTYIIQIRNSSNIVVETKKLIIR